MEILSIWPQRNVAHFPCSLLSSSLPQPRLDLPEFCLSLSILACRLLLSPNTLCALESGALGQQLVYIDPLIGHRYWKCVADAQTEVKNGREWSECLCFRWHHGFLSWISQLRMFSFLNSHRSFLTCKLKIGFISYGGCFLHRGFHPFWPSLYNHSCTSLKHETTSRNSNSYFSLHRKHVPKGLITLQSNPSPIFCHLSSLHSH